MAEGERTRCLWYAADGRCASCMARRVRHDILGLKDYELCEPAKDYPSCDFFKEKPVAPPKS